MTDQQVSHFDKANRVLDAKGLNCPLPLLKTKVELAKMQSGETLLVLATDRHAPLDLKVFCVRSGHDYIGDYDDGVCLKILIRNKG